MGDTGAGAGQARGWRRSVAWEDIVSAEHLRGVPLMVGIRLRDRQGRNYLLPRDTVGLPTLHALAHARGGPRHPLTLALEVPMYRLQGAQPAADNAPPRQQTAAIGPTMQASAPAAARGPEDGPGVPRDGRSPTMTTEGAP